MFRSETRRAALSIVEDVATRDHYKAESRQVIEDFLVRDLIVRLLSDFSVEIENLVWIGLIWHSEHARDYQGVFEVGHQGHDLTSLVDNTNISYPYKAHMCCGSDADTDKLLRYLLENTNNDFTFNVANQAVCNAAWSGCKVRSMAQKHFFRRIPNDTLSIEAGRRGLSITGWLFVGTNESTECENLKSLNSRINELIALGQRRCAMGEVELRRTLANMTLSNGTDVARNIQQEVVPKTSAELSRNYVEKVTDDFITEVKAETIKELKGKRGSVSSTFFGTGYLPWIDDTEEKILKRMQNIDHTKVISALITDDDGSKVITCVAHFCDVEGFGSFLNDVFVEENTIFLDWGAATIIVCVNIRDLCVFGDVLASTPPRATNTVLLRLQS